MSRLPFIVPAASILVAQPPTGPEWLHEIKWDGWRIQIIRDAEGIRIYSRHKTDWTKRLPGIVAAARELKADAFIIDAELISSGDFNDIPAGITRQEVSAIAFDLLHLDGADLRREPLEDRKETLANLLADAPDCIQLSDVFTDSAKLLEVAVEYGLEGIVSKRLGSAYSSNRCFSWLKTKTSAWKAANADRGQRFRKSR